MTDTKNQSDRKKVLLIPALAMVLFYVLFAGSEESTSTTNAGTTVVAKKALANLPQESSLADRSDAKWPSESLNVILSHNPFELRDPRVIIDRAFAEAGLSESTPMKEITVAEFYPQEKITAEPQADTSRQRVAETTQVLSGLFSMFTESLTRQDVVSSPAAKQFIAQMEPADASSHAGQQEASRLNQLQRLSELQNQPVTMIIQTQNGNSAILGSRKITEGELLEDGIRVAVIDRTGITLEIETGSTQQTDSR